MPEWIADAHLQTSVLKKVLAVFTFYTLQLVGKCRIKIHLHGVGCPLIELHCEDPEEIGPCIQE